MPLLNCLSDCISLDEYSIVIKLSSPLLGEGRGRVEASTERIVKEKTSVTARNKNLGCVFLPLFSF